MHIVDNSYFVAYCIPAALHLVLGHVEYPPADGVLQLDVGQYSFIFVDFNIGYHGGDKITIVVLCLHRLLGGTHGILRQFYFNRATALG